MRRCIKVFLLALTVIALLCACGQKESPAEDFLYEIVDGEIVITGYRGTDRELVIPAEIENRPVTQIGEEAFYEYDLTSIVFPKHLQIIGKNAFADCDCLTEITFSDSVIRIDGGAFYDCGALEHVELPENLEYLGGGSFMYCEALAELEIPDGFVGFQVEYKAWMKGTSVYQGETIITPVSEETSLIVDEQAYIMIMNYGTANYDVNLILK